MQNFIPGTPVQFEEVENFRQLGGYTGFDGKKVKMGAIYRSGAHSKITTPKDIELFKSLKINTVIDFRSKEEIALMPEPKYDGINYLVQSALYDENGQEVRLDLDAIYKGGLKSMNQMVSDVSSAFLGMPFNNPAYKLMFMQIYLGNLPLNYHCSAGKDRTGIATAIILRALGVSDDDILYDFELSNTLRPKAREDFVAKMSAIAPPEELPKIAQAVLGVERTSLEKALAAIDKKYPDFEEYLLKECDVTKEMLNKIRSELLV